MVKPVESESPFAPLRIVESFDEHDVGWRREGEPRWYEYGDLREVIQRSLPESHADVGHEFVWADALMPDDTRRSLQVVSAGKGQWVSSDVDWCREVWQRAQRVVLSDGTIVKDTKPRELWHLGEIEARAQIADVGDPKPEQLAALREAIKERDAIEAEIALLSREHEDVDALASNLPALHVPDEHRVFARLVWLVRRWWTRLQERHT